MEQFDSVQKLIIAKKLLVQEAAKTIERLGDKSIPLDVRWDAYVDLVRGDVITDIDSYGDGLIDTFDVGRELTLMDDFYIDRYQTVRYTYILERVDGAYITKFQKPTAESISKWKEKVLSRGTAGFVHDW